MISVQEEDFDCAAELRALCAGRDDDPGDIGGIVTFLGLVRGSAGGRPIARLTLEHYPGMTERMLAEIEAEARRRWPLQATRIIHRFGRLRPGDQIVFVACAAAHRDDAFQACRFLIDWLKTRAPFWKQELGPDGESWVSARAEDALFAAAWEKGSGTGSGAE